MLHIQAFLDFLCNYWQWFWNAVGAL